MFSSGDIQGYNIIQKTFTDIGTSFIPRNYKDYDMIKEKIREFI